MDCDEDGRGVHRIHPSVEIKTGKPDLQDTLMRVTNIINIDAEQGSPFYMREHGIFNLTET
jgi:hypothetical protein